MNNQEAAHAQALSTSRMQQIKYICVQFSACGVVCTVRVHHVMCMHIISNYNSNDISYAKSEIIYYLWQSSRQFCGAASEFIDNCPTNIVLSTATGRSPSISLARFDRFKCRKLSAVHELTGMAKAIEY